MFGNVLTMNPKRWQCGKSQIVTNVTQVEVQILQSTSQLYQYDRLFFLKI